MAFYAALLGPACLILLINTAVFIMVSRVILKPRFKGQVGSNDSINPAQIRGAFTVMTLLGVTWVFGPLAINEAKIVINYLFAILNSLQGFLIFVFRCCFNPEVRASWILLIKTGKFKRRKGPVTYTSETSSKGDSKANGSYTDTMKSKLYNNSLGKNKNNVHIGRNHDTHYQSRSNKNIQLGFDDLQKHKGEDSKWHGSGRNGSWLYQGGNEHTHRNGHDYRVPSSRYDNGNGITTIYTGRHNGVRRVSGYIADRDELTRL